MENSNTQRMTGGFIKTVHFAWVCVLAVLCSVAIVGSLLVSVVGGSMVLSYLGIPMGFGIIIGLLVWGVLMEALVL